MSLRRLLKWHKFTVQTNDGTVKDSSGAPARKGGWITTHNNLLCNFQATPTSSSKGKDDTIMLYGMKEVLLYYTIFHKYTTLTPTPSNRFLVHVDPRQPIVMEGQNFITPVDEIRILEFLSSREPVAKRTRNRTLFEVYTQQTYRQSLV